jgi:hypothetical protein
MPFQFHLSWSAPPPVKQAAHAWIIQDAYMAVMSVSFIILLERISHDELESPWSLSSMAGFLGFGYMGLMALHIRWRWVRNLGAMPKAVACVLVNSPAAVFSILATTTLWGLCFNDLHFVSCLWWILAVMLVVFLWWCISIDRAISANSPPHPKGKTDDVLDIWAFDCSEV